MRFRHLLLMLLVPSALLLSACAPKLVIPSPATVQSSAPVTDAVYDIKIETAKSLDFSARMDVAADSLSNPMSLTRDSTYLKSKDCCTKDAKTGKLVALLTPGTYKTGVLLNVSMVKANPSLLHVVLDVSTAEALKTFTDVDGNSIQLPSVRRNNIDTVVGLNSKGRGSFKIGDSTVTLTRVVPAVSL